MGLLKGITLLEQDSFSFSGTAEIFTFAAIHHWNWINLFSETLASETLHME